ncbi:MAG TPA: SDR family oxidoreductase [Acidimicrobiales bacterium]|nr:SDR family oxidoreductase [Acidimicrobiales bacterium]
MGTVCITGSASGIGATTRALLEGEGHRVVGVDRHDAEVVADLATAAGRTAMVEAVAAATGGVLDGLVAGAGVQGGDPRLVISVNYFGTVATLEGLRPLLARGTGAAAVAISSNSATTMAGVDEAIVAACLAGDEDGARAAAERAGAYRDYPSSKLALARWVRRHAPRPEWIGAGVRLNAVAPGPTDTPMVAGLDIPVLDLGDVYPVPIQRVATPGEQAAVIAFLLSPAASYVAGAVIPVDGGGEAAARADDWPAARP